MARSLGGFINMTKNEFNMHYQKLAKSYPQRFGNKEKADAIAKEVSGLSGQWFERFINRIIAANDPLVNLMPMINSEKSRIGLIGGTKGHLSEMDIINNNSTDGGYENILKNFNATSLWQSV